MSATTSKSTPSPRSSSTSSSTAWRSPEEGTWTPNAARRRAAQRERTRRPAARSRDPKRALADQGDDGLAAAAELALAAAAAVDVDLTRLPLGDAARTEVERAVARARHQLAHGAELPARRQVEVGLALLASAGVDDAVTARGAPDDDAGVALREPSIQPELLAGREHGPVAVFLALEDDAVAAERERARVRALVGVVVVAVVALLVAEERRSIAAERELAVDAVVAVVVVEVVALLAAEGLAVAALVLGAQRRAGLGVGLARLARLGVLDHAVAARAQRALGRARLAALGSLVAGLRRARVPVAALVPRAIRVAVAVLGVGLAVVALLLGIGVPVAARARVSRRGRRPS